MSNQGLKYLIPALVCLLPACGPSPATDSERPVPSVETIVDAEGTRTVARKVQGVSEGRTLVYLPTDSIGDIFYFHQGKLEGPQRRFYSNGKLARWQQYHQNRLHGISYLFYESGRVASIGHYSNGQRTGVAMQFDDRPNSPITEYIEYVIGEGRQWKTRFIRFDAKGHIVERWGFLHISSPRDTLNLGDTLTLNLQERYPRHEYIAVVTGNFDEQFSLRDSTDMGRIVGRGYAAILHLPATKRGPQVARGYLEDFQPGGKQADGAVMVHGQRLYFTHSYFVR